MSQVLITKCPNCGTSCYNGVCMCPCMPQENKDWKLDFEQVVWPHTLAILYDNQIGSAGAASLVKKETMGFIQSLLDKQREEFVSKLRLTNHNLDTNVGMLNFINELTEIKKG